MRFLSSLTILNTAVNPPVLFYKDVPDCNNIYVIFVFPSLMSQTVSEYLTDIQLPMFCCIHSASAECCLNRMQYQPPWCMFPQLPLLCHDFCAFDFSSPLCCIYHTKIFDIFFTLAYCFLIPSQNV